LKDGTFDVEVVVPGTYPTTFIKFATEAEAEADRRLSDALAECDARGCDALPLAPKELSRLFPHLWETTKAAERWCAKNPPEAIREPLIY